MSVRAPHAKLVGNSQIDPVALFVETHNAENANELVGYAF